MINLPKPSILQLRGSTEQQSEYIYSYLSRLVAEVERYLGGIKPQSDTESDSAISKLFYNQKGLNIMRVDGSQQIIESNKVLWSGAYYMREDHTANLSSKVSEQPSGIVLVFSAFANGSAQQYHFQTFFIPKEAVRLQSGKGFSFPLYAIATSSSSYIGTKYLYIHDDKIVGNQYNDDSSTINGISFANNHWVLRYVIGV